MGIKREKDSHNTKITACSTVSTSQLNTNTWLQEKQPLIEKIDGLKSENQRLMFDLKQIQQKTEAMATENRTLTGKLAENDNSHLIQLNHLRAELDKSNNAHKKMNDNNLKRIAELTREKNLFRAQFKQLQNGHVANVDNESNDCNNESYDVERILDEKMIRTRWFFVRWTGYDSSHDSWVDEKDLNCPRLLKKYIQSKNK